MALEGLAWVLDDGAVWHLDTRSRVTGLQHSNDQLFIFLEDVVENVLSHKPTLHVSQEGGDEICAVENAATLRDYDEKGVPCLQKEAEDFSPGEEGGLEFGLVEIAFGLHLWQLLTGRAGLPQFVVDADAVDSLLEGSRFVHLLRDVSLTDHSQESYQLIEILVHHESSPLLALLTCSSFVTALGRGQGRTAVIRSAGRG